MLATAHPVFEDPWPGSFFQIISRGLLTTVSDLFAHVMANVAGNTISGSRCNLWSCSKHMQTAVLQLWRAGITDAAGGAEHKLLFDNAMQWPSAEAEWAAGVQVPRILNPVVLVLEALPQLCRDENLGAYIHKVFGSIEQCR